jgi:hypothetical protein
MEEQSVCCDWDRAWFCEHFNDNGALALQYQQPNSDGQKPHLWLPAFTVQYHVNSVNQLPATTNRMYSWQTASSHKSSSSLSVLQRRCRTFQGGSTDHRIKYVQVCSTEEIASKCYLEMGKLNLGLKNECAASDSQWRSFFLGFRCSTLDRGSADHCSTAAEFSGRHPRTSPSRDITTWSWQKGTYEPRSSNDQINLVFCSRFR